MSKEPDIAQRKAKLSSKYMELKKLYQEVQTKLETANRSGESNMSIDTLVALMETQSAVAEEKAEVWGPYFATQSVTVSCVSFYRSWQLVSSTEISTSTTSSRNS